MITHRHSNQVRDRLPAVLEKILGVPIDLSASRPMNIDLNAHHSGTGSGVVEPWCPRNCSTALETHSSYKAGGSLLWVSLAARSSDGLPQDDFSYAEHIWAPG